MPTDIAKLGEFGLIERISKDIQHYQASTLTGIGDDAAVLQPPAEQQLLLSTDMLLEGVHFDLAYVPLKHLGYKAVAVNLSDIAAMNALPTQITVSLAVSNRFSVEAIEELYEGINVACKHYHVDLVGGDTTSSRSGLVISITALGYAKPNEIVRRSTAKTGEIICVTGDLGGAYAGLQILEREKRIFLENPDMQPKLTEEEYVVMRQLKPEARLDIVRELRAQGIVPTAMIDISDGLASELMHICRQSGVGAVIYEERVPIERVTYEVATEKLNISPITCALNGGEDYELLFTVPLSAQDALLKIADVSMIGYTRAATEGLTMISRAGQEIALQAQGWQHFNPTTE